MKIKNLFIVVWFLVTSCSSGGGVQQVSAKITATKVDNNNYTFQASTEGTYTLLKWDFGDGSTASSSTEVSHRYIAKGVYTVELALWNNGEKVSDNVTITIPADDPEYGYKLVWSDEFNGSTVSDSWTAETGYIANNELQDYQSSGNHVVKDGMLTITANKMNDDKKFGSYTSARLNTSGKQEFTYGKIEARMRLPKGLGTWPAFWMLGGNIGSIGWPKCGEIDIMEYVGYDPHVIHGTIHCGDFYGSNGKGGPTTVTNESDWHVYGVIWSADKLEFYVDSPENIYYTYNPTMKTEGNWPFGKPHFLILNLAIGGDWGGAQGVDNSIFPVSMDVDWVRVYQKKL